jgi:hypothetical protein
MTLPPEFIDQAPGGFACALSFFSKEAFRFYRAAYLLVDRSGKLLITEVLVHLIYGLTDTTKDVLINPSQSGSQI